MSDPMAGLQAARERVRAQVAQAKERQAAMQSLTRDLADARATITSPGGEVTACAGANGAVQSVDVHDTAYALTPPRLGTVIAETVRAAQRAAAEAAVARTEEALGQTAYTAELRTEIRARFAGPDDAAPDAAPRGGGPAGDPYLSRFTAR